MLSKCKLCLLLLCHLCSNVHLSLALQLQRCYSKESHTEGSSGLTHGREMSPLEQGRYNIYTRLPLVTGKRLPLEVCTFPGPSSKAGSAASLKAAFQQRCGWWLGEGKHTGDIVHKNDKGIQGIRMACPLQFPSTFFSMLSYFIC